MPTNPLQPFDDNPKSWLNRITAEFSSGQDRLKRRIRRIIVRAAKEESAHLVAGLVRELHAARSVRNSRDKAFAGLLDTLCATTPESALSACNYVVGRVGVLETQLESSRSAERIATARAESAEAECAKLRLLLNARSEPV